MQEEDGDTVQRMPLRKSTHFLITASGEPVLVTPDSGALDDDSGKNLGELDTGEPDTAEQDKKSPSTAQHKVLLGPKDYKRLKYGKDAPFHAELQCLKPQLLAQALASFIYLFIYLLSLFSPKKEKRGSFKRKKAQKNPRSARASRGPLRGPSRQGTALGPGVFCRGFACF